MNGSSNNQHGVGVQVRGLRKSFGGQEVLCGLDFDVQPGEIFVIMGPSGSGKTVLLKHIIGLEEPDAGEILIEGQPIHSAEVMNQYRMAMVFQSGALLNSLTVGENVGLYLAEHRLQPPEEIARIVSEKLEVVGLKDAQEKMPSELSGGMKKRVAIARALVIEPQLILYDEPTSELDPLSAVVIAEEIVHLKDRIHVTSLVVSHDRNLAFGVADRIAVINEGRILTIGTPEEVNHHPDPLVQQFLHADFKRPGPPIEQRKLDKV
jgi:phospholipid/cholesterol/gamma-HCH transport system ATP-binding protein